MLAALGIHPISGYYLLITFLGSQPVWSWQINNREECDGELSFQITLFNHLSHQRYNECLIQNSKDCGAGGGGALLAWRTLSLGRARKLPLHCSGFLLGIVASPTRQDLLEKPHAHDPRWDGRQGKEPKPHPGITRAGAGHGGCHPNTPIGTSPSPATGWAGAGRTATRPR